LSFSSPLTTQLCTQLAGNIVAAQPGEFFGSITTNNTIMTLPAAQVGADDSALRSYILQEIGDLHILNVLQACGAINWKRECYLFPLKTTGDGNCLLHSAALALWGTMDGSQLLRHAVAAALESKESGDMLRDRWQTELGNADSALPDAFRAQRNWDEEWRTVVRLPRLDQDSLSAATGRRIGTGGASLLNIHVFTLAQLLRRPIVVYAAQAAELETGESMTGVFLPSFHPPEACVRQPLLIAYTPGHFTVLLPIAGQTTHAPLCNKDGVPLAIRFEDPHLPRRQVLDRYLDVIVDFPVKESAFLQAQPWPSLPETRQLMTQYLADAKARFEALSLALA
jgi:hypothetical protein